MDDIRYSELLFLRDLNSTNELCAHFADGHVCRDVMETTCFDMLAEGVEKSAVVLEVLLHEHLGVKEDDPTAVLLSTSAPDHRTTAGLQNIARSVIL